MHKNKRTVFTLRIVFTLVLMAVVLLFVAGCSGTKTATSPGKPTTVPDVPREVDFAQDASAAIPEKRPGDVRLLTYNIQWGKGADGVYDLDRIAARLRQIDADVVILNEVDVNWGRSGHVDQPAHIVRRTDYEYYYFGVALSTRASGIRGPSRYGNLLLSRFPIVAVETVALPGGVGREPRSAVVATIDVHGEPFVVAGTHLGLHAGDRMRQVETILGAVQRAAKADALAVILGDFNARPTAPEIQRITGFPEKPGAGFVDAQKAAGRKDELTFPFPEPYARIDYIFLSPSLADGLVDAGPLPLPGSDHFPVIADVSR